jgi:hypothetical protein
MFVVCNSFVIYFDLLVLISVLKITDKLKHKNELARDKYEMSIN